MTPASYVNGSAIARYVDSAGFGSNYDEVYESYGIKPVINLKANSLKSGDGTTENPYTCNVNQKRLTLNALFDRMK